jgi:hypothetical protein
MKYGIIVNSETQNCGDDIQSIAAMKLVGNVDFMLERESLSKLSTQEEIKLLCNGWFMSNPDNWPPAPNLYPLFISFHITNWNKSYKKMVNYSLIDYYKKFEPIGCRDQFTLKLFQDLGLKAYYSGCLTLTLENHNKEFDRNDEILLIDPISHSLPLKFREKVINELVPASLKKHVVTLTHEHPKLLSTEERFKHCNELLNRYAKAHLIVTSRIHAALPALAYSTPVLFLDIGFHSIQKRSRFGGILDLFTTINENSVPYSNKSFLSKIYREIELYKYHYKTKEIDFDWDNPPKPPEIIKEISYSIKKTVNEFIKH